LGVLVLFFQKARSEEFEAVALPHLNDRFRTARRLLGEQVAAEDVVQEVYLQTWKLFHSFERGANCRAWLFTRLSRARKLLLKDELAAVARSYGIKKASQEA
jgi:DNA-directed RNA polymerase specialized sigma24 family protein